MTNTFQPIKTGDTAGRISILVGWINERGISRPQALEITGLTEDELSMMVDGRFRQLPAYRVASAARRAARFNDPVLMDRVFGPEA